MTNPTYLTKAKIGAAYFAFRMRGDGSKADEVVEQLPGVYRSARAANTALRAIAAETGETIRCDKTHKVIR